MIVYTTIFGRTHRLLPQPAWPGVEYVCFTDRDIDVPGWRFVKVASEPDPLLQCKRYKLRPHLAFPEAAQTLWIDSRITLRHDPRKVTQAGDFCVSPHRMRTNITDEAQEIIRLRRADPVKIARQLEAYKADGFDTPANPQTRLAEVGAMLRRHTPAMVEVCERWHAEVLKHSPRDQMSLDYVCWKLGFELAYWDDPLDRSPYFDLARANRW